MSDSVRNLLKDMKACNSLGDQLTFERDTDHANNCSICNTKFDRLTRYAREGKVFYFDCRGIQQNKVKHICEQCKSQIISGTQGKGFIQIFVKTLDGHCLCLNVNPYDTVKSLKEKIPTFESFPKILCYNNKELEDSALLSEYNIKRNSTVHCVLRC